MRFLLTKNRPVRRRPNEIEVLTPRLLEDAGLERKEDRSVMAAMLASFTGAHVVEKNCER